MTQELEFLTSLRSNTEKMMKKVLYLTFYFEPDLCAGSFRNSPLVKEFARQSKGKACIDVFTTLPNRYGSFEADAPQFETLDNYTVNRIQIPLHDSGMKDQILSFKTYYLEVKKRIKGRKYDLVIASSSRLFTAYLGYDIAHKLKVPLFLDIRDIFYDTLEDVLSKGILKTLALPIIKQVEKRVFGYASHINLISGGFRSYFDEFKQCNYSFYPNGVDDIFIDANVEDIHEGVSHEVRTVIYAGNLGEGQGLHKIIPKAAKALEAQVRFIIIGDGGAKRKLEMELKNLNVQNVELRPPIKRDELIALYKSADFLFVHLNNYKAFEKVLPSKIFELATFPKPIIAGVGGFAADFIQNHVENSLLFRPCNVDELVNKIENYEYKEVYRTEFVNQFRRETVNRELAKVMLKYI